MGDVMTKEERVAYDRALKFNQDEDVPQPFDGDVAMMHSTIDRLVSEVERLRARNEALEKVAKAASTFRDAYLDYIDGDDRELPDSGPELDAALSALAEPGKGGAP